MATAKKGDQVQVHYTGRLPDGTVFDSTDGRDPLGFEAGGEEVIPGVSAAVVGMQEGEPPRFIDRLLASAHFEGARISTIDGLRADFEDGWGLVRASNTTPVLVLRFEADNDAALARIMEEFRRVMLQVEPALSLPF